MTDSPFLPGTNIQFAWDSTTLGALKTCPRYYQLSYIEGWVPKDENIHLRFGNEYHAALEDFDKLRAEGRPFEDALHTTVRNLLVRVRDWSPDTETKAGHYKNPRTLLQLVVDYIDEFRADPAATYVLANGKPAVELSFKLALDWGPKASSTPLGAITALTMDGAAEAVPTYNEVPPQPYLLCGHLDKMVELGGSLFVLDHKTTTTTPSSYFFDNFSPGNQMTLYTIASRVVYHAPVRGVIIDAAQIKLQEPNRFERGTTLRTEDQLEEWLGELHWWLEQAEGFATANYWPMNDTACDKYGGCRFRGVCSKSPSVRETWLRADFNKQKPEERWNPLKSR